jgi:ATP-dependent RNA helicase DeaD
MMLPLDSIERLLTDAEYRRPTRFQRFAMADQLKGSSAVYETASGDGKTVAYCAPAVFRAAKFKRKTLILCLEETTVEKVLRTLRLLDRGLNRKISVLSLQPQVRNKSEAERFIREWDVATGTPGKVIDTIRIGRLSLGGVKSLVIDCGDSVPDAAVAQDIAFILSKLNGNRRISIMSSRPSETREALRGPIPSIRIVEKAAWNSSSVEHRTLVLPRERDRVDALADVIFARSLEHLWILCENSREAVSTADRLSAVGISAVSLKEGFILPSSSILADFSTGRVRAFVSTPQKSCAEEDQADARGNVVFIGPFFTAGDYAAATRFLEGERPSFSITTLFSYDERDKALRFEEMTNVEAKKDTFPANDEVMKGVISSYLEKIRHDENPDDMNAYRKIIQRSVPFFMRSYFAAYLFKQLMATTGRQQQPSRGQRNRRPEERNEKPRRDDRREEKRPDRRNDRQEKSDRPNRQERPDRTERPDRQEPTPRLPESEAVTLFVGIGKNRRVYAKDIVQLFGSVAHIDRSRLGQVKIMDNYSFIQISTEVADDAIAALNNADFRGRKLIVNFARKKQQSDESGVPASRGSVRSHDEAEPEADREDDYREKLEGDSFRSDGTDDFEEGDSPDSGDEASRDSLDSGESDGANESDGADESDESDESENEDKR